jgi:hypothetical protein
MKNLILFLLLTGATSLFSQKSTSVTFSGGLWAGVNKTTTFVGFIGPKLSTTFSLNPKTKLEIGVNGIPGAVVNKHTRFGLAIGSTITLKRDNWKIKPIIGVAVLKTDTWQIIYGIGFLF